MKLFILAFVGVYSLCNFAFAQPPVSFVASAKKIDDLDYELRIVATAAKPWHIYSMRTPEGGPVPTSISFAKNPVVKLRGKVKEEGKVVKKREEVFELDVLYFDGQATWVQNLSLSKKIKTKISGTLNYMLCNDEQCQPPADYNFSVAIE